MSTKRPQTKYRVLNPNRINEGTFIFRCQKTEYMEGDEFTPPSNVNKDNLTFWIENGYVEVIDG
jgi:hypothetical protein|tara:strand:+ start:1260 stop:1451 length:192 start_codon:yes stop_codon:yes gene_type:complete